MRPHLAVVGSALLCTGLALAQAGDLPPLRAAVDRLAADLHLEGAGLVVVRDGTEVYRSVHGQFTDDLVLPIASASKWLCVATVLSLVDAGVLDLDVPVARYVEEFDRADKQALTLRQCLACTGGLAPRLPGRMRGWDMRRFAAAAADAGLRDNPGAAFRYGGLGFQIAAVAVERATGKSWHEVFAERIASPLGLQHTQFGTLLPVGGEPGRTPLPWVAGGAVSTLADYSRFLQMLVAGGRFGERQVLSAASVQAMFRDQVREQIEVKAAGFDADRVRYGLGSWIEELAEGGPRVSDPGAFGFTPWIDLDLHVGGVFAVRDRVSRVLPRLRLIQDEVRATMVSPIAAGTETTVAIAHDGRDRRYHLHVPPPSAQQGVGMPLLLVLHGGGGSGEQVREATNLAEVGTRAGFVVVFPDGTGPLRGRLLTWNSGGISVYAADHDVDDVGFLREVVADAQRRVAIDPARVYAVGHSNGGMMCHRLAREAADVFAGIAVVSGAMDFTEQDATTPIAALLVHGTADEHVLLEGGTPRASLGRAGERIDASLQDAIDYYLDRNGLSGYPETEAHGKVRVETYATTKEGKPSPAPVRVVRLEGGGHTWPGSTERPRAVADQPFPYDASRAIVDFFAALRPTASSPVPR
ncbi:MAG TPA: alpha/beta fold hydrolase [Planctomycetota bacterium]|nr:alpha/beta fold hydrolase [Planctomycetota bacterium]